MERHEYPDGTPYWLYFDQGPLRPYVVEAPTRRECASAAIAEVIRQTREVAENGLDHD